MSPLSHPPTAAGEDTSAAAAVGARPVLLGPGISLQQAVQVILNNCLDQVRANGLGLRHGLDQDHDHDHDHDPDHDPDPERIHQMRVGLRRLRVALRVLQRWAPLPLALQPELRWLGGVLGVARDADVLARTTLQRVIDACPQETALAPLQRRASTVAVQKRRLAAKAVASARYARLMVDLAGWLQAAGTPTPFDAAAQRARGRPVDKQARKILDRCHGQLLKSGEQLLHGSAEQRHRVRIKAKQARYATEFFQALLPAARVGRYLRRLAALQDTLGGLNDATVAEPLLRALAARHPQLDFAAGFACGYLDAAARPDLSALARGWKQFSAAAPP